MSSVNCSVNRRSPPCFSRCPSTISLSRVLIASLTACKLSLDCSMFNVGSVVKLVITWISPDQRAIKAALFGSDPIPNCPYNVVDQWPWLMLETLAANSPTQGLVDEHPAQSPSFSSIKVCVLPCSGRKTCTIPILATTSTPFIVHMESA